MPVSRAAAGAASVKGDRCGCASDIGGDGSAAGRSATLRDVQELKESFDRQVREGPLVVLSRRLMSDQLSPVLAYRRLVLPDERTAPSFLFESVESGSSVGTTLDFGCASGCGYHSARRYSHCRRPSAPNPSRREGLRSAGAPSRTRRRAPPCIARSVGATATSRCIHRRPRWLRGV